MNVKIDIDLVGHFCNDWPNLEIYHEHAVIYDGVIKNAQHLSFIVDCNIKSNIKFRHKNKFFGENNRWDSNQQDDRYIQLVDVRFDDVSIGPRIMSSLIFHTEWSESQLSSHDKEFIAKYNQFACQGRLGFNGTIDIPFTLPVYNWLILNKFKLEKKEMSYFSQYTENFHYEKDLELIAEIKRIMKLD